MTRRYLVSCVVVIALGGCKAKEAKALDSMYCEGGVIKDAPGGGECLSVGSDITDSDPNTVGTAIWVHRYTEHLIVRRVVGTRQYSLLLNGVYAGSIQQTDDNWITVTFTGDRKNYRLRSDAPGFFM